VKTIYLSDEAFKEIAGALDDKAAGQEVLIEVLCGRFGPHSDQVQAETKALERLADAAHAVHGISTWRSNGARTMPAGSPFKTPGEKA
jgi:hypothetical protein